ncbi:hypothetical protein SDC9_171093 [bioreactor metagenome]|uniref:Uncharacterized protein n=1 Tax=bioreactor metagenome TaxID=1076179 RepID=A0A645GCA1_9ZZZZ
MLGNAGDVVERTGNPGDLRLHLLETAGDPLTGLLQMRHLAGKFGDQGIGLVEKALQADFFVISSIGVGHLQHLVDQRAQYLPLVG